MRFLYGLIAAGVVVVTFDLAMVWYAMSTSPELDHTYDEQAR